MAELTKTMDTDVESDPIQESRFRFFTLSPQLLLKIVGYPSHLPRPKLIANALPEDIQFVNADYSMLRRSFVILTASKEFEPVEPGIEPPMIEELPMFETQVFPGEESLAKFMHDEYEKAAKKEKWKTPKKCQVPFDKLPAANRRTMLRVAERVLEMFR